MGRNSTPNVTILAKKNYLDWSIEAENMGFSCRSEQIYLHLLISIGKSCFLLQYPAWNISGHPGMNQYTE